MVPGCSNTLLGSGNGNVVIGDENVTMGAVVYILPPDVDRGQVAADVSSGLRQGIGDTR